MQEVIVRHDFDGRDGRHYHVDYFSFPGAPRDEKRSNLELPQFSEFKTHIDTFIRIVWPGYEDTTIASTIDKFNKFSHFVLAYFDNTLVAFNIYKVDFIETKAGLAKAIYVEHAGTLPEHQGNGVTLEIRKEFYRRENPDIICGSSANQFIYQANKNIAKDRGMTIYPRPNDTDPSKIYVPKEIQELAVQITETLEIKNAELDPKRLVRTYDSAVAPSPVPHELHDLLQLNNCQHVFYILVDSDLNKELIKNDK